MILSLCDGFERDVIFMSGLARRSVAFGAGGGVCSSILLSSTISLACTGQLLRNAWDPWDNLSPRVVLRTNARKIYLTLIKKFNRFI